MLVRAGLLAGASSRADQRVRARAYGRESRSDQGAKQHQERNHDKDCCHRRAKSRFVTARATCATTGIFGRRVRRLGCLPRRSDGCPRRDQCLEAGAPAGTAGHKAVREARRARNLFASIGKVEAAPVAAHAGHLPNRTCRTRAQSSGVVPSGWYSVRWHGDPRTRIT